MDKQELYEIDAYLIDEFHPRMEFVLEAQRMLYENSDDNGASDNISLGMAKMRDDLIQSLQNVSDRLRAALPSNVTRLRAK